ncbi:hypothetical protein [Dickeya chrysanthemi]|uniref:hypothetical protein n=1 Tax=Dickeya chrysanthemi TaxID=556 RepID=UPI0005870059|nr:hypothetical protein [Dickeya chrysanthemi]MBX9446334.1 hypothetical protein [Dickeya chrysanthemi]
MDKITGYFTKDIVVSLSRVLSHSQYFAIKIKNDELSWRKILFLYFGFWTISRVITNSIFEFYLNGKVLNDLKLFFFQTIYIFIFSFLIRSVMFILKGRLSYEKTLKLFFIYGGVIYIINSILMMFDIYLDRGGNRLIVFFVSSLAAMWISISFLTILKINEVNGKARRTVGVLLLIFSSFLLSNITSVMAPYLILMDS